MKNMVNKYEKIGFIKNIIICVYDLMLLFSVLFFMSLPWVLVTSGEAVTGNIFYQLYLLMIILTYYLWFWIRHGQTLGMKSWKTYVLNTDNTKINIRQGILRIILALVGGHLVLIFTNKSLQDIISNSHIVKLKS
tara:strand:+ start:1409 stop:1813 length:405 start_codon:yes stop_codon:yes gene_type:complete